MSKIFATQRAEKGDSEALNYGSSKVCWKVWKAESRLEGFSTAAIVDYFRPSLLKGIKAATLSSHFHSNFIWGQELSFSEAREN